MHQEPKKQSTSSGAPSMPRPVQDELRQNDSIQESHSEITVTTLPSRFVPLDEEEVGTSKLSRTNSVNSLPESSSNYVNIEDLENQINSLIKPWQEKILGLSKQLDKVMEENTGLNKKLTEQQQLIEHISSNNEALEAKLIEQKKEFELNLAQEKAATSKFLEDFKPQIFSRLEQHKVGLNAELANQTKQINASHTALQQNVNSVISELSETEQKCYKDIQTLFMFTFKPEVSKFLDHVGFGEQDEAESMLQVAPQLATLAGDLTDCAGRKFKQITGFQYAIWALDYHMWTMIKKYLDINAARSQMAGLSTGSWVSTHGTQVTWQPLITALETCARDYTKYSDKDFCQKIGGAQLLLPAHVISEYCHPTRSFAPIPKWTGEGEAKLPRNGSMVRGGWKSYNGMSLGDGLYWWRANSGALGMGCSWWIRGMGVSNTAGYAFVDGKACCELLKSRVEHARALGSQLKAPAAAVSPRP